MKFEDLIAIIPRIERALTSGKTHRQIAADLEAEFSGQTKKASSDSQKAVQGRRGRKPGATLSESELPPQAATNGFDHTGESDAPV